MPLLTGSRCSVPLGDCQRCWMPSSSILAPASLHGSSSGSTLAALEAASRLVWQRCESGSGLLLLMRWQQPWSASSSSSSGHGWPPAAAGAATSVSCSCRDLSSCCCHAWCHSSTMARMQGPRPCQLAGPAPDV